MANSTVKNDAGTAGADIRREAIHLPLPFVDESEGGWCSDKPRRKPGTDGSWVDFDGASHPGSGVYEED